MESVENIMNKSLPLHIVEKKIPYLDEEGYLVKPEEPYFINPSVDETTGITGWRFRWGSTGLCPLGRGLWYISENGKDRETGKEYCRARLYRWSTKPGEAFVPAE